MKQYTCWLCGQRDRDENLEREERVGKRARYVHLECNEEAAYLFDDFVKYELPAMQAKGQI